MNGGARPPRVLALTVGFGVGGAGQLILATAPRLAARGFDMRAAAQKGPGPMMSELQAVGIPCATLGAATRFDAAVLPAEEEQHRGGSEHQQPKLHAPGDDPAHHESNLLGWIERVARGLARVAAAAARARRVQLAGVGVCRWDRPAEHSDWPSVSIRPAPRRQQCLARIPLRRIALGNYFRDLDEPARRPVRRRAAMQRQLDPQVARRVAEAPRAGRDPAFASNAAPGD